MPESQVQGMGLGETLSEEEAGTRKPQCHQETLSSLLLSFPLLSSPGSFSPLQSVFCAENMVPRVSNREGHGSILTGVIEAGRVLIGQAGRPH